MTLSCTGFTHRIIYRSSRDDIVSIFVVSPEPIGINARTAVRTCVNPANVNRHYSGSQLIQSHATVEVEKEREEVAKMAELHKEIAKYLAKQRERVCVTTKRQERNIKAAAQETVGEAYARRCRELGW